MRQPWKEYEAAMEGENDDHPESRPERPKGQSREISGDGEQSSHESQ